MCKRVSVKRQVEVEGAGASGRGRWGGVANVPSRPAPLAADIRLKQKFTKNDPQSTGARQPGLDTHTATQALQLHPRGTQPTQTEHSQQLRLQRAVATKNNSHLGKTYSTITQATTARPTNLEAGVMSLSNKLAACCAYYKEIMRDTEL